MKRTVRTFALAGMLMLMPVIAGHAEPGGNPGYHGPKSEGRATGHAESRKLFDDLELSAQQVERLKKDKMERRKTMIRLRSELDLLHAEMAQSAFSEKPDMKNLEDLSVRIGDVHARMTMQRIRSLVFLRSLLTDEQKKLMDSRHLMMTTIPRR
ncbi:periplasmic heavy metal sensor [Prosthecochloris sp. DSM 1685]|nr:periplasmic heavy metal sensor [Prosthecochloris ethylica]